jgi:hypothetical protein
MIADRKDHVATLNEIHARKQAAWQPVARLVQGAAVVMDGLVRTDEWARYATYVQGVIERATAQRTMAMEKLADPALQDAEVRKLRSDILIADTTVGALKFAIGLPVEVIKGGEEAKEFIKKFEGSNETPANP